MFRHILDDLHEIRRVQARHDALLEEWTPFLRQFRQSPAAGAMAARRARRRSA